MEYTESKKRKQTNNQNRNQYQKIKNWRYFEGVTNNYTVLAQVRLFSCSYCRYFFWNNNKIPYFPYRDLQMSFFFPVFLEEGSFAYKGQWMVYLIS